MGTQEKLRSSSGSESMVGSSVKLQKPYLSYSCLQCLVQCLAHSMSAGAQSVFIELRKFYLKREREFQSMDWECDVFPSQPDFKFKMGKGRRY